MSSQLQASSTKLPAVDEATISKFRDQVKSIALYKTYELRTDDDFLIRFLRMNKNNVQAAVKSLIAYYQMLLNLPRSKDFTQGTKEDRAWLIETLTKIDKDAKEKFKIEYPMFAFYGQDKKGRGIIGFDVGASAPFLEYPNFLDASLYGSTLVFDHLLETYDFSQEPGIVFIDDWGKFNLKMFTFYMKNPAFVRNFSASTGTMPMNMTKYYVINGPTLLTTMYNAFKIFLPQSIKDKMCFTGNTKAVVEEIGKDGLPYFLKGPRKHVMAGEDIDVDKQLMKIFPRKRQIQEESFEVI